MECFGIDAGIHTVAITGAGGKTSLMYALAMEFSDKGETVITTTTTKIFPPDSSQSPLLILLSDDSMLLGLSALLQKHRHVTLGRGLDESSGKLHGIGDEELQICLRLADRLVVEADGAANKPVKAPEDWEPAVPDFADLVIPVAGLDCLGKPATDEWVFRLERFLKITGLQRGQAISAEALERLLANPDGSLKGAGLDARIVPFLNKEDLLLDKSAIRDIANQLRRDSGGRIKSLVHGSLKQSFCNKIDLI